MEHALLREDILFWIDNYIKYWDFFVCAGMYSCIVALISRTDVNGWEMFFRRSRKTCGLFVLLYIQTFSFSAFSFKHWSGFHLIYSLVFDLNCYWIKTVTGYREGLQRRQAKYFKHLEQWFRKKVSDLQQCEPYHIYGYLNWFNDSLRLKQHSK